MLVVTATSPDDFLTYTYELDVSGGNPVCIKNYKKSARK